MLSPRELVVVGVLPEIQMERMGMPADIFSTRTENEIISVLQQDVFKDAQIARPTPEAAWAAGIATRYTRHISRRANPPGFNLRGMQQRLQHHAVLLSLLLQQA